MAKINHEVARPSSIKKHLNFDALRQALSDFLYKIDDPRQKSKTSYSIHDVVMSGFACMFLQCPSLMDFGMVQKVLFLVNTSHFKKWL